MSGRDRLTWYRFTGPASEFAVEAGLDKADWFRSDIPRQRMKQLMRRSDWPAIRDTAIWLGLGLAAAAGGIVLWGSWWALPCFLVYGVLYGSASDSRWHEAGHGTAFRTRWMDQAVYQIASFCMMRNPTITRWHHTRHHSETLIVGRDPEIQVMRPARLAKLLLNFVGLVDVPISLWLMTYHAAGRLSEDNQRFVPEQERHKVHRAARVALAIHIAAIAAAIALRSWLPVVLIGGPRIYGTFLQLIYAMTQHAGLGENVLDYRLNTRTVHMCRINRFLYWNMNYHIEHHMFPMVPYHHLPALHEELRRDLPEPYPSIWAAYREIIPAIRRQLTDQTYFIKRELPPTAAPYHGPVNGLLPEPGLASAGAA